MFGEIDFRLLRRTIDRRMVKDDGKAQAIAVVGLEARPLVAVADFDRPGDADEFLGGILFLDARRLDQEHEGRGRAIEDGHFRRIEVDPGIVDAEAAERRHQVFDGADLDPVALQAGTHAGVADQDRLCGNIDRLRQINATKDDAGVRCGRAQGQIDLDTAVQTDARGMNDRLQRALL
ncbi:hypothetical protein SDC9_180255 [bioreactor metagenome]|uniref:Uncharacterized protein n=1 Tax=bioreactor metagenome TaxID=1076179 RepID=A0A645H162_9ZZZZ